MTDQNHKDFNTPVYLFHKDCPKGRMFEADEVEERLEEGWVDTPARLKLPENDEIDLGLTKQQVEKATADDIVSACKAMGFVVLTPEQLQAEANKMANVALDIKNFTDEALTAEFYRRFGSNANDDGETDGNADEGKTEGPDFDKMLSRFNESPESLNKDELLVLGTTHYDLSLRSNMKEATMIDRIKVAMNQED